MRNSPAIGILFYIRKLKKGDYGIYCCIKLAEVTPTEICILSPFKREDWDISKGRPLLKTDELIRLSLYLDSIRAKLMNIFLELKLNNEVISAQKIKTIYLGKEKTRLTILSLIDKAVVKYKDELAEGSLKNYAATREYVRRFCAEKYPQGDIALSYLAYDFMDELKTYMLTHPMNPGNPCNNNGCMKHLERLKKITRWAFDMRMTDRNVFATYQIKKKRFRSKRLSWSQLSSLENHRFVVPRLDLVRDLFVFCCYTGLAPIDLQKLKPHQISANGSGEMELTYHREKSSVPAVVPLLDKPLELIKKYQTQVDQRERDTVFPLVSNKDLNDNLKIISEVCQLGMPLNFYMARHTFGTTITLLQGVPITSISAMMGHEKIETTMKYAEIDVFTVEKDMIFLKKKMRKQRLKS